MSQAEVFALVDKLHHAQLALEQADIEFFAADAIAKAAATKRSKCRDLWKAALLALTAATARRELVIGNALEPIDSQCASGCAAAYAGACADPGASDGAVGGAGACADPRGHDLPCPPESPTPAEEARDRDAVQLAGLQAELSAVQPKAPSLPDWRVPQKSDVARVHAFLCAHPGPQAIAAIAAGCQVSTPQVHASVTWLGKQGKATNVRRGFWSART